MKILAVTQAVPKTGTVIGPTRIGERTDGTYTYCGPYVWWRDDKGRLRLSKGTVA